MTSPPAGAEAAEDVAEASPQDLAETADPESAFAELIAEGYEPVTTAEAAELEQSEVVEEVGTALEGEAEGMDMEFAFLAALIPALVSAAGPPLARAVARRLSPKVRRRLARLAGRREGGTSDQVVQGPTGQVGMFSQRGPVGPTGMLGQRGVFGQSGMLGQSGMVGQSGMFGQSGMVGQSGMLGESGQAGQPGQPGQGGQPGQLGTEGFNVGRILSMIARIVATASQEGGAESESGAEQALAAEAAAVLEVIIGSDDRVQISNPARGHWRQICALWITFPSGRRYRGTGFLTGPRTVVTAGHCVYLAKEGGWAREIEVIPGASGASRPYGSVRSRRFRSVVGWVRSQRRESDYGCIELPDDTFARLGYFGFAALNATDLRAAHAVVAGYPGDKPANQLWGMGRRLKSITPRQLVYDIDTMGGQSGAPVYIKRRGSLLVCGIHNYGGTTGNNATRITRPVYQRLRAWSRIR